MEKKNTILLTVIAIATLLVAVVGATFAYFTATVTTDKADGNNTTTVKTYALASAKMEMGSKVEAAGVYPGYKAVKSVAIKGECPEGNETCQNVNAVITVTPTIASEFGSDVTWKLYKSNAEAVTCTSSPVTNGGQYYDSGSCTIPEGATLVTSGSTSEVTEDVVVTSTTNDTYYLVVDYANNAEAAQNAAQGKSFSVAIDFASKQ